MSLTIISTFSYLMMALTAFWVGNWSMDFFRVLDTLWVFVGRLPVPGLCVVADIRYPICDFKNHA